MANRSKEWNEDIASKLKKKSYRKEFFLGLIEEEQLDIREAIYVLAKSMGNQEFAEMIGVPPSNASRMANPKNTLKWETIQTILECLDCKLTAKAC